MCLMIKIKNTTAMRSNKVLLIHNHIPILHLEFFIAKYKDVYFRKLMMLDDKNKFPKK